MTGKDNAKSQSSAELIRLRPKRPCPICTEPSKQKFHPFCSARCADVDLHKWLGGQYRVPAAEQPDFEEVSALPSDSNSDKE